MNIRTRIAAGATAAALVSIFGLAGTAASAAPSVSGSSGQSSGQNLAQNSGQNSGQSVSGQNGSGRQVSGRQAAVDLPVTGTLPDGSAFTGRLSRLAVSVVNGAPMLSGVITGTALPVAGTPFTAAILSAQAACPVLTLNLAGLNLDLLGLVVDLAPVNLNIAAVPGAGNVLGNLVCAIAGALDGGILLIPNQLIVPILGQLIPVLLG
jgi:hypothetical protein